MASPENQRAATDSNNDLDLALNLDLELDRDLDSPTASASSATALETVVPGRAGPSFTAWSPSEAPNLKKYPMSYLPAHPLVPVPHLQGRTSRDTRSTVYEV